MDGWIYQMIYESTDGSTDVLIDGSIDWSIDWSIDGLMDDSIDGLIDVLMDWWMDEWINGWMDGLIKLYMNRCIDGLSTATPPPYSLTPQPPLTSPTAIPSSLERIFSTCILARRRRLHRPRGPSGKGVCPILRLCCSGRSRETREPGSARKCGVRDRAGAGRLKSDLAS